MIVGAPPRGTVRSAEMVSQHPLTVGSTTRLTCSKFASARCARWLAGFGSALPRLCPASSLVPMSGRSMIKNDHVRLVAALFVSAFTFLSYVGCSSDPGPAGTDASAPSGSVDAKVPTPDAGPHDLPCDVDSLLSKRCHECHDGSLDLPRLVTYDDLEKRLPLIPDKVVAEVALGKMTAERGTMPPPPRPRVQADEVAAFRAWLEAGRPRGSCNADGGTAKDASSTD